MNSRTTRTRISRWFRSVLMVAVLLLSACGGGEDLGGEKLSPEASVVGPASAAAMGEVTSVRFQLSRSGSPVFVDQAESLALDGLEGRFSAPGSADALLRVTVSGSLRTTIGAVAIDEEIWMSNPVTGAFETLPPGYDIDPSLFFDPKNGWQPLLERLQNLKFVGEEDREGTKYHLTATAPAEEMAAITAGLVRGEDVFLDVWVHPVTGLVTAMEFDTNFQGETSSWVLELSEYGETFNITDPTL